MITKLKPFKKKNLRDSDATREALMHAGSELFAAHGYEGVSVETIAERAGANKAMISYHFGGKRELYRAIITDTFDEVGAAVTELAATGMSAPELLTAFVDLVAEIATTRRPAFPALFMREVLSADRLDKDVFPRVSVVIGTLMQAIARGVKDGTLRPVDPFCAYWSLMAPLTLFLATEPTRRRAQAEGLVPFAFPTVEEFAEQHKATVMRALRASDDKESV